ncbi:lysozyme inhibitor LprI family protein [Klebsiella pneumoniae]|uniref:lysozyme inhibitor LprI family protein n=1 Tax=Klebsiella pneumoniae TaxID=573 RepID=UPI0024A99F8B|nr:lysozyme inhibitor LprI family protein [Klebsiella pneumoniae]HDO7145026.1 DUF1311 domain-containing protein [Klebsiella pneumoniae]HDO7155804.1 DUF1311 domain-containing protein [Klebsiella pneumoniae]
MKISTMIIALLFVLINKTATAAENNFDCVKDSTTQMQIDSCASDKYKQTDKEMNELYFKLNSTLKNENLKQKSLLQSQRNWLKTRDSDCQLYTTISGGGSINNFINLECLSEKTILRINFLKSLYKCETMPNEC